MVDDLEKTKAALEKRGYTAKIVTREEALAYLAGEFAGIASVGWGGSETVKELGVRAAAEALAAKGALEIRDHRTDCDLFLLSANALTLDGLIVNIDGTGNRVAASIYGPKRVVYLIGRNKLVEGGYDEAVVRVKRRACPPNCRRLGKRTPCAGGTCPAVAAYDAARAAGIIRPVVGSGCESPDRICKATVVFERAPTRTPTTVLLLNEDLGY